MKSKIFKIVTAGTLALGLLTPVLALAEDSSTPTRNRVKTDLRVKVEKVNFCTRFTESEDKLHGGLSEKSDELSKKRVERDVFRVKKVGERQTKLSEKRKIGRAHV